MIGVIAPYSKFKEDVEKISRELNLPVKVEVGALRTGLVKAKEMIKKQNVKVIIARGSTANFLKEKLGIPIIKIDVTNFDVIKTLHEAKKLDESVYLIDHINNHNRLDIKAIKDIVKIDIILKQYTNEREITNHISEIAQNNTSKIVVGTAECMASTAGNKGMLPFIVFSESDSILEALLRAQETLENFEREKIMHKHLESIISLGSDGIISTNMEGNITVCNKVASEYLGILASEIIGRNVVNIHIPLLKKLLGNQQDIEKKIITNGNNKYLLNRVNLGGKSLVVMFQKAESILQLDTKIRSELYHRRFYAKYCFDDIIYRSEFMEQTLSLAKAYAKSDGNLLIYGESGTGKELLAQSIHNSSKRKHGPFIAVNCAALPENLLESELFGYEEGAFTGAVKGGKPGLFEMAHGGTLFLDEIGEVNLTLQTRLLRVLQEREVRRIGGERNIPVDVRVVSATNKDLNQCIEKEQFRSDLYYRLNILYLTLPPLRERKKDLDLLIDHLLIKHNSRPEIFNKETRKILNEYNWPGNIRELENVIERAIAIRTHLKTNIINILNIEQSLKPEMKVDQEYIKVKVAELGEMEEQIFAELMKRYNGNKAKLAEKLGVSRTTLWKKLKKQEEAMKFN